MDIKKIFLEQFCSILLTVYDTVVDCVKRLIFFQ